MHASLGAIGRLGTVDDDEPPIDEKDELNDSPDDIKDDDNKRNLHWQRSTHDYYSLFSCEKLYQLKNSYNINYNLPLTTISKTSLIKSKHNNTIQDLSKLTSLLRIYSDYVSIFSYREIRNHYNEMFEVTSHFARIVSQELFHQRGYHERLPQLRCYPYVSIENSPLSNLRSICEIVREFMCETSSLFRRLSPLSMDLDYSLSSLFFQSIDPFGKLFKRISFYSTFMTLLGHYLVRSGLIRLSNLDVNRSTHQELWDMSRGVEELNILTNQLKEIRIKDRTKFFNFERTRENFDHCSKLTLEEIIIQLANLRANHLVHLIKEQIIFSPSFVQFIRYGNVRGYDSFEEHYNYLLKSGHIMPADYLRNEYEFSSAILDIFSQSTELFRELRKSMFHQKNETKNKGDLNELKEKNKSNLTTRKDIYSLRQYTESSWNTKLFYSYSMEDTKEIQSNCVDETRHSIRRRMSTFNSPKKVRTEGASGFVLSDRQLTSVDFDYDLTLEEFNKNISSRRQNQRNAKSSVELCERLSNINESDEKFGKSVNNNSPRKKNLQWSDFEEVPLRHQAVGRYLELLWHNVSNKILHEWLNPYPSRLNKSQNNAGGFLIKSLSKQHSHSYDMDYQGYLPTGILFFNNDQLHSFSKFISIISRSEIFPSGLLPILNHQSAQISFLADRADFINNSFPNVTLDWKTIPTRDEIQLLKYRPRQPQSIANCDPDAFIKKHFIFSLKILRKIAIIFDCDPIDLKDIDALLRSSDYAIRSHEESDLINLGSLNHLILSTKHNIIQLRKYIKNYLLFLLTSAPNNDDEIKCLDYIRIMLERYKSVLRLRYFTEIHKNIVERMLVGWNKVSGWMEKTSLRKMVSHFPHNDDKRTNLAIQLTSSIVTKNLQNVKQDLHYLYDIIEENEEILRELFKVNCFKYMASDLNMATDNVNYFRQYFIDYFTEINQTILDAYSHTSELDLIAWQDVFSQILLIIFDSFFQHLTICMDNFKKTRDFPLSDLIPMDKLEDVLHAFEVDQKVPDLTKHCLTYANLKKISLIR